MLIKRLGFGWIMWTILMVVSLAVPVYTGEIQSSWSKAFSHFTVWTIPISLILLVVVGASAYGITQIHPVFKWSIMRLFTKPDSELHDGANLNVAPARIRFVGPFFILLLAANMPRLAWMEEELFRDGTESWTSGLVRSLVFGLVHCLVGVPIGAGFALSLGGLAFTYFYFQGGVDLAATYHTFYNLIVVAVLLLSVCVSHFEKTET